MITLNPTIMNFINYTLKIYLCYLRKDLFYLEEINI